MANAANCAKPVATRCRRRRKLCFRGGSGPIRIRHRFVSEPLVYTYLIHELNPDIYTEGRNFFIDLLAGITPPDLPWVSLYWVFTLLLLVMLVAVGLSRFPKIELKEDEKGGSKDSYLHCSGRNTYGCSSSASSVM